MKPTLQDQLSLKELELNALLETMRAINSNAPEEALYKIYKFIVSTNPVVDAMALYVNEQDGFICNSVYGFSKVQTSKLQIEDYKDLMAAREIEGQSNFPEPFDFVIPVRHKNSLLAYVFIRLKESYRYDDARYGINFIETLSNIILVAIENKRFSRKVSEQMEVQRQMELARSVQEFLFPKKLPKEKHVNVAASYVPHHSVGGDYYDFIQLAPYQYFACIADVSGKGFPAALMMSNFQAAVRTLTKRSLDLEFIARELNEMIFENAQGEHYITAFFAIYDARIGHLAYVNAGHNPPLLFHGSEVEELEIGTTVLGAFPQLPLLDLGYIDSIKEFFLLAFTDGLTEAETPEGEQLGVERVQDFIKAQKDRHNGEEIHTNLLRMVEAFQQQSTYQDDITLLSIDMRAHEIV